MNLFKFGIHSRVETGILEHLGDLGGELHIRVEVEFGVKLGIDPGQGPSSKRKTATSALCEESRRGDKRAAKLTKPPAV